MKLGIYEIGWDIRAAFQKLVGDVQKIRKGQLAGRTFKKCRAAARNQKEDSALREKASAALGCSSKKFFKFIMVGQKARELIDQTQFFR